jgi:hypothetical protein
MTRGMGAGIAIDESERPLWVESQNSKYGSTAVFRLQMVVRRAQTCLGV